MVTALFWSSMVSLLVIIPTAIAARVLHEFSRFELEGYCRRHNRPELFDEVLDYHERFALTAEAFQWIGNVGFLVCSSFWYFWTTGNQLEGTLEVPMASRVTLWILGQTIIAVLLNSWIPWAVVKLASAPFLFHTWKIWKWLSRLTFPVQIGYAALQFLAHRIAGKPEDDEEAEEEALEEEIRTIVTAGERDGLLESPAREMIEGVINLDDVDVGDIMTPRSKVNALDISLPIDQLVRRAIDFGHTRIPIYEGELQNVVGILFVKDLLPILFDGLVKSTVQIRDLLRQPQFVPISIHSDELLQQFRESHSHLSIVVDEYETVVGVVTIEDVLEEIVGEITDETDEDEAVELVRINDRVSEVVASIRIDDVNEQLKLDLPNTDDFDTLAGLVLTKFERIPNVGESFVEGNVRIEVHAASQRKIDTLRLEIIEENSKESDGAR